MSCISLFYVFPSTSQGSKDIRKLKISTETIAARIDWGEMIIIAIMAFTKIFKHPMPFIIQTFSEVNVLHTSQDYLIL